MIRYRSGGADAPQSLPSCRALVKEAFFCFMHQVPVTRATGEAVRSGVPAESTGRRRAKASRLWAARAGRGEPPPWWEPTFSEDPERERGLIHGDVARPRRTKVPVRCVSGRPRCAPCRRARIPEGHPRCSRGPSRGERSAMSQGSAPHSLGASPPPWRVLRRRPR